MIDQILPNYVNAINQGIDRGKDLALNSLAQQAYQAPEGPDRDALIGQAIGINREQGLGMGSDLQARQDAQNAKLGAAARYVAQAYQASNNNADDPRVQGAFQAVRPFLMSLHSASGAQTPTPDNFTPDMLPHIYQIIAQTQGATMGKTPAALQTFYGIQDQLPADQRQSAAEIKAGTAPRAQADKWQTINIPNGDGSFTQASQNLRTAEIRDLSGNVIRQALSPNAAPSAQNQSPQAVAAPAAGDDFYGKLGPLVSTYGGQVTSTTRSPEHNAAVGGVPDSQHLTGNAADVVVSPAGKAGFIEAAKNAGYTAIDEGDHIHVQAATGAAPAATGGPVLAKPGQPGYTPPKQTALQQRLAAADSLGASDAEKRAIVLGANAGAGTSGLTSGATEDAAWNYLLNGKAALPPVGRGAQGQQRLNDIMNKGDEIAKSLGVTPDEMATTAGRNKAYNASLQAFQKRSDAMQSAEQGFRNNMQTALQLSQQVDRTGSPLVNKWLMAGEKDIAGDPQLAALDTALTAASTDYARIMSGQTGSGGTPISTAEEAKSLMRKELTDKQLNAVADVLYKDIHGQEQAVNNQRSTILGRLRSLGTHQVDASGQASDATPSTAPAAITPAQQSLLDKYK